METWDKLAEVCPDNPAFLYGFLLGCSQKYVDRYDKKNGIEDLNKLQTYIHKVINNNNGEIKDIREAVRETVLELITKFAKSDFTSMEYITLIQMLTTGLIGYEQEPPSKILTKSDTTTIDKTEAAVE